MGVLRCMTAFPMIVFLAVAAHGYGAGCGAGVRPDSLVNGGFEFWTDSLPDGWLLGVGAEEGHAGHWSKVERIEDAKEGRFAVRLSGSQSTERWYYLGQTFPAHPGDTWRISGWVRARDVDARGRRFVNCNLFALAFSKDGGRLGGSHSAIITGTTGWRYEEFMFRVPPDAGTFKIGLLLSVPGVADFDGIRIEPIPAAEMVPVRTDSFINGSFEVWPGVVPDGWTRERSADEDAPGDTSRIERIEDARDGRFAIRLSGSRDTKLWYSIAQTFRATPGDIWILSGWLRTLDVREDGHWYHNCGLFAICSDKHGERLLSKGSKTVRGTTDWHRKDVLFKIPKGAETFKAGIFLSMSGAADFDGLRLERYSLPTPATTREERWLQDLTFLMDVLPRSHLNPFTKMPETEFRAATDSLGKSITRLKDHEIIVGLMRILAGIGDAHTGLVTPDLPKLPAYFHFFGDGAFLIGTTKEHRDLLRYRLIRIGNFEVEDVCERLRMVIPHENEAHLLATYPRYLMYAEVLHALGIIPDTDRARFVLEDEGGSTHEVEMTVIPSTANPPWISAVTKDKLQALLSHRSIEPYWYEYLVEQRALYIQYRACTEMPHKVFRDFAGEVLACIDTCTVDKVIIDMRQNGGGNSSVIKPLINGLVRMKNEERLGDVYLLVGRRTFSSAVLNAVQFEDDIGAILVGEPTGGKPNSFGEIDTFTLPHSGLTVYFSTKYFRLFDDEDPPSLIPDIVIEVESEDYFSITDPVLDAVLELE
ncbi:MAG: hypothetical protein JSV33_11765 [bacterium]|nr:MAG: hypothetical protein JSV33_11765 [bacterium]